MSQRDYKADELRELEDWKPPDRPEVCAQGIAMHRDYSAGELMTPGQAQKLAAQLLAAAGTYDAIYNAGMDSERIATHWPRT